MIKHTLMHALVYILIFFLYFIRLVKNFICVRTWLNSIGSTWLKIPQLWNVINIFIFPGIGHIQKQCYRFHKKIQIKILKMLMLFPIYTWRVVYYTPKLQYYRYKSIKITDNGLVKNIASSMREHFILHLSVCLHKHVHLLLNENQVTSRRSYNLTYTNMKCLLKGWLF